MITTDALLAVLRDHIGKTNGASAAQLVAEINAAAVPPDDDITVTTRDLRKLVVALREQGHHVCAHPQTGYFLAATVEELEETRDFLRQRALSSLKQIAAMDRISLPDLFGQLHLPT
jgi:hypothetical protein